MNKRCLVVIIACCCMITASAQTLFTYGKYSVDAKDFLKAYNKNNTKPVLNKKKAMSDYLELYINSRLKIQEAYEKGYDTLPQIKSEVDNLRAQIVENYMSDPETTKKLVEEAFKRSQKDIHTAGIFISFNRPDGTRDTIAARMKADAIMNRLQKGEDFLKIAKEVSEDPSAVNNSGDMGFITVFTLPYEFENVVYGIAPGKFSLPYRSRIGYHIFKNLGERKALGKIKVQQILLAIPPDTDEAGKKKIAQLADSLYHRILAGDDFEKLAGIYSNDYVSAVTGGKLPDISVGQYEPEFENIIFSLPKDGAVTKPFYTSHGYHIVRRISLIPVVAVRGNNNNERELQQKIAADGRWKSSRRAIYDMVIKKAGFKKYDFSVPELDALSDSVLENRPIRIHISMNRHTPLLKVGDSVSTVSDWIVYAQAFRFRPDGTGAKPYDQVMEEFIQNALFEYYRNHLEMFNNDFRNQMAEFRDGNLFFEIMQREIWNKAQSDSAALMTVYQKDKSKYIWKESADAVIFFCSDAATAKTVNDQVKKDPASWRKVTESMNEKVVADSSRYEKEQLPNLDKQPLKAGLITDPLVNKNDNTASFAYIINVYPQPMQRSFNEAKGMVINDYQSLLEERWNKALREKYPVVINQAVLNSISK